MATTNQASVGNEEAAVEQENKQTRDPLLGVPEALQIHLGDALDWMENRTEPTANGLRIQIDDEQMDLREWKAQDLSSCFDVEDPEADPYREAVLSMALLLKVRSDLKFARDESNSITEAMEHLEENPGLFDTVFQRIQKAIDAAVLRGSLVGARNLSRVRDLVGVFRSRMSAAQEELESRRKRERRSKLKGTGAEFAPAEARRTAPKVRAPRARASQRSKPTTETKARKIPNRAYAHQTYPFPWLFCLMVVMALVHWGLGIHAQSIQAPEPNLDRSAWERILPLKDTFTAGGVLYAVVGEEWNEIPYRERLDRFQRLHERAELSGYKAVVLTNEAGDFAAKWGEGAIAQVWTQ